MEQEDDDENLWEVERIVGEKPGRYRVRWAGFDPKSGKRWPDSWVPSTDVTDDLKREFKHRKAAKRRRSTVGGRSSSRFLFVPLSPSSACHILNFWGGSCGIVFVCCSLSLSL